MSIGRTEQIQSLVSAMVNPMRPAGPETKIEFLQTTAKLGSSPYLRFFRKCDRIELPAMTQRRRQTTMVMG